MRRMLAVVVAGGGIIMAMGPVMAHHAFSSEFDANQPITLRGTVTKTEWINPHSWIYVDVKEANGKVASWKVECGAPNALLRRGWNKNSLPIGSEIVVEGFRAKNGTTTANANNVMFPDGRKMFVGSSGTGAPYDEKNEKK